MINSINSYIHGLLLCSIFSIQDTATRSDEIRDIASVVSFNVVSIFTVIWHHLVVTFSTP